MKELEDTAAAAQAGSLRTFKAIKVWHFYGDFKFVIKNRAVWADLKNQGLPVGKLADIVGIMIGVAGFMNAAESGNKKGMTSNALAITGGFLGLTLEHIVKGVQTGSQALKASTGKVCLLKSYFSKLIWSCDALL